MRMRWPPASGADLGDARGTGIEIVPSLAVSCLDQAGATLPLVTQGTSHQVATDALVPLLLDRLGFEQGTAAYGPSRGDAVAVAARRRAA